MFSPRTTFFAVVVGSLFAAGSAIAAPMGDSAATPADQMIVDGVRAAIARQDDLQNSKIAIKADHGRVQLAGWVSYPRDLDTARRTAAMVQGVTRVDALVRTWASDDLN